MNARINEEQIATYQRDGCLLLGDFLSPAELEEMRAAVAAAVEKMGRQKVAGGTRPDMVESETDYNKVFLQRLNLWKIDDTIKGFFLDPELGEMLCKLAGIEGVRMWHDQTLQKAPWARPTAWHMDNPKWSFSSPDAISIWIALDDATVQNGCLYFLPGSHKIARYDIDVATGAEIDALFDLYPELRQVEPIAAELKAGQAAVHNGLVAHGAGPNMTPRWRRAMTCAYMPDGATFNGKQNILSQEMIDRLEVGDLLNDESHNPLVWPSSE